MEGNKKGKSKFTKEEDLEIERLIELKQGKSRDEQKSIRAKIRKIGFHYSEFSKEKKDIP